MKNTILKIKSDNEKENVFRINLRQDRSADRVVESQRNLITADMIAKRRNDLNRSVNLKTTRPVQMYSATNRNPLLLNNHLNEKQERENNKYNYIINNPNFATINNPSINGYNNMTINKNNNTIFTPIHANINLNSGNNNLNSNINNINKVKNENTDRRNKNENRLFSPILNKNMSTVANQTQKKGINALNGTFKLNTNNNPIYTPNNVNSNRNNSNMNTINNNSINTKNNNNNIKTIIQANYNSGNNSGTPNQKEKSAIKEVNNLSEKNKEKDFMSNNNSNTIDVTKLINMKSNINFFSNYNNSNNNSHISNNNNLSYNEKPINKNFFIGGNLNIIENSYLNRPKTPVTDSKNIYNPSAKAVKEYSYKEDRNSSFRNSMEDFSRIIDKYMNDYNKGLFCLYDGHGGSEPVKYVRDRLPEIFSKFLIETKNNVEKSLNYTFQKLDDELKNLSDCENVGTTACVLYIYKDADIITGGRKTVYCANIGDTRCILLSSNGYKRMSYDHKCTDESEVARIRKVGGVVFNGRVFGQLALSRALGDHAMKKYGVICTPHINRHIVNEKDRFIVMCSDGVWDVLGDEDVYNLSLKIKNAEQLAASIVNDAVEKGSRDNISCIVVKIN